MSSKKSSPRTKNPMWFIPYKELRGKSNESLTYHAFSRGNWNFLNHVFKQKSHHSQIWYSWHLSNFPFDEFLRYQKWQRFMSYSSFVYVDLVRIFYCNPTMNGKYLCSSVKGKKINPGFVLIAVILGIVN